jgi:hypothetical protein
MVDMGIMHIALSLEVSVSSFFVAHSRRQNDGECEFYFTVERRSTDFFARFRNGFVHIPSQPQLNPPFHSPLKLSS